jgi:hypothetical protein
MPKLRLKGGSDVTIEVRGLNATALAGGVMVAKLPNGTVHTFQAQRPSSSIVAWTVPGVAGAVCLWLVDIPGTAGVSTSDITLKRTARQAGQLLLPSSVNPKEIKIKYANRNGDFYHVETIELV